MEQLTSCGDVTQWAHQCKRLDKTSRRTINAFRKFARDAGDTDGSDSYDLA